MGIAGDIASIVVAALVFGLLAQRLKMPALLGYIVAGIVVGPNTLGPTVVHPDQVEVLADIGIALLLFTAGLEFPVERLAPVKWIALIGTPIQILLSVGLGAGFGHFVCGWSLTQSIWFGCIISVSSTMVVLKILGDKGLTGTLSSQVMTAILIVQDLAVIPMLVLLPELSNLSNGMDALGMAVLKSVILIGVVVGIGSTAVPKFVTRIAALGSRELFMVTVLAMGLGLGMLTYQVGLSFAFGAFLAGILLSRSDFSHQALSEITPLKDLFSLLFFVSVGLLLDLNFAMKYWVEILVIIGIIFVGKALIFGVICKVFGYVNIMPLAVGLYMFQVGEFAFVLAKTGMSCQGITRDIYLLAITVAALTIAITPIFAGMADPIYQWWKKRSDSKPSNTIIMPKAGLQNHVVMIGYGRMSSFICNYLADKTDMLVIESVPRRVAAAKEAGFNVIGGNAASRTLLEAADLESAALAVITLPDPVISCEVQSQIHAISPSLKVLARAAGIDHMQELTKRGCTLAVVPEYDAGLTFIREIASIMSIEDSAVKEIIKDVRMKQYAPMLASVDCIRNDGKRDKRTRIFGTQAGTFKRIESPEPEKAGACAEKGGNK